MDSVDKLIAIALNYPDQIWVNSERYPNNKYGGNCYLIIGEVFRKALFTLPADFDTPKDAEDAVHAECLSQIRLLKEKTARAFSMLPGIHPPLEAIQGNQGPSMSSGSELNTEATDLLM